ncbi:MAG: chemotaxis protein CheW [Methanospirillaceae archaeon]|nr:chemotaxis protein CheW [Methanospirillaceae archaeon]
MTIEIVEFELGSQHYAMDIQNAREIVEMLPITRIPRAPRHISGMLNLRGEITTIINIHEILGISNTRDRTDQKIVVLVPSVTEGANLGIIVDDVQNVRTVEESDIDKHLSSSEAEGDHVNAYIKGIIKIDTSEDYSFATDNTVTDDTNDESIGNMQSRAGKQLLIWIDISKIIGTMKNNSPESQEKT